MTERRMIFHHPERLHQFPDGASRLRPVKMLKAFQDLGFTVDVVAGTGAERKKSIRQIKENVKNGVKYDFLYSEASTMPTMLTESHHLPLYPFLDFGLFFWFRRKFGPVGVFYRDIYWRFPQYRTQIGLFKSLVGRTFYWIDLFLYRFLVDHIFLPSVQMKGMLPFWIRKSIISGLPSGSEAKDVQRSESDKLRLLYVGGILPPYYDMIPMMKMAKRLEKFCELTICCRKVEWDEQAARYQPHLSSSVKIVHTASDGLDKLYREADVFILFREKDPYLSFAMPYKIFEAVSYGVPILTRPHEASAKDIADKKWGWICDSEDEAAQLIENLAGHREILQAFQSTVTMASKTESWCERTRQVSEKLVEKRSPFLRQLKWRP